MNELDKLRGMLNKAKIPYRSIKKIWDKQYLDSMKYAFGKAGKYMRNQIIYGEDGKGDWKFDAIWQAGSYGANEGKVETYGHLGVDEHGEPRVMTAEEAFSIISEDWEKQLK